MLHIEAAASASRVRFLTGRYKVPEWFVQACGDADPTPNGQYAEWLVKAFKSEGLPDQPNMTLVNQIKTVTPKLELFGRLRNNPEWVERMTDQLGKDSANIHSYSLQSLVQTVDSYSRQDLSKNEQERELLRKKDEYLRKGVKVLTRSGGYTYCLVETPEAGVLMSRNTHWCVKNESTCRNYIRKGELIIVVREDVEDEADSPVALIFIPEVGVGEFEMENPDGHDLYTDNYEGAAMGLDRTGWNLIQPLVDVVPLIQTLIQTGRLYDATSTTPNLTECEECGGYLWPENGFYFKTPDGSVSVYDCHDCVLQNHQDEIHGALDREFNLSDENDPRFKTYYESKEKLDLMLRGNYGSEVTRKVFQATIEAAKRLNIVNPETKLTDPYIFNYAWYKGNFASALKAEDANYKHVYPGISREDLRDAQTEYLSLLNTHTNTTKPGAVPEALMDEVILQMLNSPKTVDEAVAIVKQKSSK